MIKLKKYIKNILIFIVVLFVYFIPGLIFKTDVDYYNNLVKPVYAPPSLLFGIMWPVLFILLSILITKKIVNKDYRFDQVTYLIVNYFLIFFFNKVFFIDKNLLFTSILTILTFITSLFLFINIYKNNKKESILLIPYVIWALYASILIINVYLIN